MNTLRTAPFGLKYRELWLPEQINALSLPSAVGGHALTLSGGAAKKTTADGVHFDGTANSYLNCGVVNNSQGTFWVSLRFRSDEPFAAGGGNKYLFDKYVDASHYLQMWLSNETGNLLCACDIGAGNLLSGLTVGSGTWNANQWYHAIFSISATNGARLRLDNGTAVTNANKTSTTPAGGNQTFGNNTTPGTYGFVGDIADIMVGTGNLTTDQEADLYKGIPPALTVNFYPLDEGRAVTSTDLGSGANNGTLGSANTWRFGRVVRNCIGLDGIDAKAESTAFLNKDMTIFLVLKAKSTYSALSSTADNRYFFSHDEISASLYFYYVQSTNLFALLNSSTMATSAYKPAIDEYLIFAVTTSDLTHSLYLNGALTGSVTRTVRIGQALPVFRLGAAYASGYDISKHLFDAIIEGAMSAAQVLTYSRFLNNQMNLGLTI